MSLKGKEGQYVLADPGAGRPVEIDHTQHGLKALVPEQNMLIFGQVFGTRS